jgi:hypothetical protein
MKNQRTSYKDFYKKIVKTSNREKIIAILKENHAWEYFKIKQIEIIQAVPYAYILIELDITGDFAAQFLGMFVEIKKYFPGYNEDNFYLPSIAYPHDYYDNMKPYINKELSLAHELLHLQDIIDMIENDSSYLEKIYKYGFENIKEGGELPESIDFEIWKNFRIEPRALENDFKNGEKLILAPFLFGMVMKYKCKTKEEYIQLKMSDYIFDLQEMYCEKFKDEKDKIGDYFKDSINKHGHKIYGDKPYEKLSELKAGLTDKMLNYETRDLKRSPGK